MNKEEKQRLILGGMIVVGVIYAYFEFLLGPLQSGKAKNTAEIAALEPEIAKAKAQLKKVADLKKRSPEFQQTVAQVSTMIPQGSPIAWFPPRMSELFKKNGVEKVTCKPNNESIEKDLPGFRRMNWSMEMPKVEFMKLGAALASLENEEPLVEVQQIEIEVNNDDVATQRANFAVSTLNRQ